MTSPALARAVDAALEATIVGGFGKLGAAIRRRTEHWAALPRLDGGVAVVTGATSGLGRATAAALAGLGATTVVVGRDRRRGEAVVAELARTTGSRAVDFAVCDLSDLEQTRELAGLLRRRYGRLDALVHNAGALLTERHTSPQGFEATVATQVLAPFLLTEELLDVLRTTPGARVVLVTSGGLYTERFDLDRLELDREHYDGVVAYARAKRAQVVLAAEWQLRDGKGGVRFDAVHPGWADTPGLRAALPRFAGALGPLLRSPAEGADTIAWLAAGAAPPGTGGQLWHDRRVRGRYYLPWTRPIGAEAKAAGPALWSFCAERTGLGPD